MPIRTGIAWITRLMMYFVIGSPPVSAPLTLPVPRGLLRSQLRRTRARCRDGGTSLTRGPDTGRGTRAGRAPRTCCVLAQTPEGSGFDYDLTYQSTEFQVGPAWVGFAKKFPSFGPTSSTFLR